MPLSFKQHIENLFKNSDIFSDSEKNLNIPKILEAIEKIDIELIKILKNDEKAKKYFFTQVEDIFVLNQNKLIEFFSLNDYMKNGSYTSYTNKIGLIKKDSFIKKFDDVVLAFPHKDCVLEGGQTKDDDKRKEVFYNEILSSSEIDRLFEPKVLTNIKRYSKEKIEKNPTIKEDDNLIIKGNNLLALHSLKKKFAGKVKLIYIDPPYNTGNDSFNYNDNFNHSTWLTFMKNRLEVAKEFLSDDGFIIVQIDDNEQAYLKVLMDEVFAKENFRNSIYWHRTYAGKTVSKNLPWNVDILHLYSKNILTNINNVTTLLTEKDIKAYNKDDNDGRGKYSTVSLQKTGNPGPQTTYDYIDNFGKTWKCPAKGWRMKETKLKALENDNRLYINGNTMREKYYLEERTKIGKQIDNFWADIGNLNRSSDNICGLSGQKPETLIERIINLSTKENDLVMDFHLGSGTTCAVAHKMNRRYIGIEQMDYIEDIAVERLKKVIDGEQGGISKAVNWSGGGEFVYAELKTIENFKNSEIGKLNKNLQYLPISEIEDETYSISKEEIAINKAFYGIENE